MNSYTVECLSTALSPITHMQGTAGNEAMIAREPVVSRTGTRWVPFLSGNAIRHKCIREPGMMWLIDRYSLRGKLSLNQLNFLLHGGNLTESTSRENTKRIAEMKRTWPLLRLVGGTLPDQILAGSLDAWRGVLVCEENRAQLSASCSVLPKLPLRSAQHFVDAYQYTRGDAAKLGEENDGKPAALDAKSNLMIFSGQCVTRGAMFYHGFVLKHVSEVELGALLWSLRLWQSAGGTIGGQASRGHGRLRCELVSNGVDCDRACKAYVEYASEMRDEAVAWLEKAWA